MGSQLWVLDALPIVVIFANICYGYRIGLLAMVGSFIGLITALIVSAYLVPYVGAWASHLSYRPDIVMGVVVLLIGLGQIGGIKLAQAVREIRTEDPLNGYERLLGVLLGALSSLVVVALVIAGLMALGVTQINQYLANPSIAKTIQNDTPKWVNSNFDGLKGLAIKAGFSQIQPTVKPITPDPAVVAADANSVVKINATAAACQQVQSGSGWVVSPGEIITNAHVVSGVTNPTIITNDNHTYPATVVYFNPDADLAVLYSPTLTLPALTLGAQLTPGSSATFDGYPLGGPFSAQPALVTDVSNVTTPDIYNTVNTTRNVYSMKANVELGNSGGPILNVAGKVVGVVFAKATDQTGLGYGITMQTLKPLSVLAPTLKTPVTAGHCVRG